MALSKLGQLERKIARLSRRSKIAPPEFLESELKRFAAIERLKRILIEEINPESMVRILEQEFKIYFEPRKTKIRLNSHAGWVYGGANGQIDSLIYSRDFWGVLPTLGLGHMKDGEVVNDYRFIQHVEERDIPEIPRRFLVAIGFLYPNNDGTLSIHSNARRGQRNTLISPGGNAFLSRDKIRIPYDETQNAPNFYRGKDSNLTEPELWKFWGDLLAMEVSGER